MDRKIAAIYKLLCFMGFWIVAISLQQVNAATITVDAAQKNGVWNRFYEQLIATDHMKTILNSAYDRNLQNAMKRSVDECGFKYFRGHGIFNSDIGLYSEPGGVPTYNWVKFDSIYDIATKLGLRPMLEFSFTPPAMASGTSTTLWYAGAPANTSMPKDLNKWRDLCKAVVLHCEERYGVDEVRKWYFEVYNEPNLGNFFSGTKQDYFKLYDYAAEGVRLADSICKVGGPSTAAVDTLWIGPFLKHIKTETNYATGTIGTKCDFLTYHRYATDPAAHAGDASGSSNPKSQSDYHKAVVSYCKQNNFSGPIMNNEWGLSAYPVADRENEINASFVTKTIHMLISNGVDYPPPAMYGYWCISDIYEEYNAWATVKMTAFDNPGNYGLCLRGDINIPDSWDVPKPAYNAFKILHKMGDTRISCTGGTFDNVANGFATISDDNSAVQVVTYTHASAMAADNVTLTVNNLPFTGSAIIEHFIVDSVHSNAYRAWQARGRKNMPDPTDWAAIKQAAELYDTVKTVTLTGNSYTETFSQRKYSVSLFVIKDPTKIAVIQAAKAYSSTGIKIRPIIKNKEIHFTIPEKGQFDVSLFAANGAQIIKTKLNGNVALKLSLQNVMRQGTFILKCSGNGRVWANNIIICQ